MTFSASVDTGNWKSKAIAKTGDPPTPSLPRKRGRARQGAATGMTPASMSGRRGDAPRRAMGFLDALRARGPRPAPSGDGRRFAGTSLSACPRRPA